VSAVIYALSGQAVARAIYPGALHIYVLVPLVLFYVERLYQEGRRRDVVYGALIVAWQIFAGHAQIILYSSLLASAYALFCAFLRRERSSEEAGSGPAAVRTGVAARVRFLTQFTLMFIFGIALSAVQLIPAWEVATQSDRQRIPYEIFVMNSLHPLSLLTVIFPFFHGGGNAIFRLPYWGPYWSHNEGQIYLGVLTLSLAVSAALCFWRERSHLILFWSIVPIIACLLAFGKYLSPISRAVYRTPLLNLFRGSDRHWMEVVFAVSILAGYAVDRILRGDGRSVARVAQYVITALVLFNAAVGLFILWRRDQAEAIIRGLPDMGFVSPGFLRHAGAEFYLPVIMAACLLISLLLFVRSRSQGRWYFLLLFMLILDFHLYAVFAPINRPGRLESGEFASPIGKAVPPEIVARQNESEPIRYHLLLNQGPIAFNPYWFYGHEMATGYDPVINTRYSAFTGIDEVGRSTRPTLIDARDRTLDLLNVRYLLVPRRILNSPINSGLKDEARWREVRVQKYDPSDYDSLVYENLKALPRAWLVDRVEARPDQEQLKLIRGEAAEGASEAGG
ncbi:MAG: hypothetical protein J2P31_17900, partial [Blastocatellia bacterium]|nr:hypothetical protein [Blastocatellia bacterium]